MTPTAAGVLLLAPALLLLVGAPVGVLMGQSSVEMAVLAIAGVGLALLHLTVVVALHARALVGRTSGVVITAGGGGGGAGGSAGSGGSGAGVPPRIGGGGGRGGSAVRVAGRP